MEFKPQSLRLQFLQHGVRSAEELARSARVSQPTISRALRRLPDSLVRIGRGRSTRYGLANPIGDLGSDWPLYVIGSEGAPEQIGRLFSLLGGKYWLDAGTNTWPSLMDSNFEGNVFPDLPWFLDDYRPQGFLGRAFARKHAAALGQQTNPAGWSGRTVVEAMLRFGGDFSGAFVLGRDALAAAMSGEPTPAAHGERSSQYPRLAELALRGDLVGSSAGGEQPKFVTSVSDPQGVRPVIVKFSPPMNEDAGRRWADLLFAEHTACRVLAEKGYEVPRGEIIDAGGCRYLEVDRFDRTKNGGRLPVISLRALAAALLDGVAVPWPSAAASLLENGWLGQEQAGQLASIWEFGRLIGNTDMHDGNTSLIFAPRKPVRLAPVYDMLPMAYRPDSFGRVHGVSEEQLGACASAPPGREREMAESFWVSLAGSEMVSKEFRAIAQAHVKALRGKVQPRADRGETSIAPGKKSKK